jgi:hypothetical protein
MSQYGFYTAITSSVVALVNTVIMQLLRLWYGFEAMIAYGAIILLICMTIIWQMFRKKDKS